MIDASQEDLCRKAARRMAARAVRNAIMESDAPFLQELRNRMREAAGLER